MLKRTLVNIAKLPWRAFRIVMRRALLQLLSSDTTVQKYVATSQLSNEAFSNAWLTDKLPADALAKDAKNEVFQASDEQSPEHHIEKLLTVRSQLIALLEKKLTKKNQASSASSMRYANIREADDLITIVVTLYNEDHYIHDAIKSLKQQSYARFKAIIVDDASTNGARASALKAIDNDPRFRLIQHLKNGGVNAARNTGLRLADTPFIAFLDADDILLPDSIERRLSHFLEINDQCVAGVFNGVVPGPENLTADYAPSSQKWSGEAQTFISARGHCPFGMHAPMLRTDILRRIGGFDENLRAGSEDWEMWQRALRHGYVFLPVELVGGVYRIREGSRIRQAPQEHTEIGRGIVEAAYRDLPADEVRDGSAYVFRKPLPHYQKEVDFLSRFISFASMAYIAGADKFAWFCENPPFEVWRYGRYSVDYKARSKSGLSRFFALDKELAKQLDPLLDEVAEMIVSELDAHAQDRLSASLRNGAEVRQPCVALFANGVAQAKAMAAIAEQLEGQDIVAVLVSLEMLTGDQGVEEYWSAQGVDFISYNTYLLRRDAFQTQASIVMRPYCGAVRDLLDGSTTIEVQNPYGDTSLPEANGPVDADYVCTREEAAALAMKVTSGVANAAAPAVAAKTKSLGSAGALVAIEERADGASEEEKIETLRDRHIGERCFILGNGPSLNAVDFSRLAGEQVFAANGFFLKQKETGFTPTFYVVSDATIMRENRDAVAEMKADYKIFSSLGRGLQPEGDNTLFYLLNRGFYEPKGEHFCVPRFSMDPSTRIFCGQSVTLTSLQLAYYMGFTQVYLLGMDFHYEVPASDTVKGELITSAGIDPNHFNSNYVSAGMTWKVPHLDRVKMGYEFARDIFESAGRKIYNASSGGKLEVFERATFDEVVGVEKPSIVVGS